MGQTHGPSAPRRDPKTPSPRRDGARRCSAFVVAALLAAPAVVVGSACEGCRDDATTVAELVRAEGTVEADPNGAPIAFERATPGHRFSLGDAVRTGTGSTAELSLRGGGRLRVGPDSIVRFSASPGAPDQVRLGVEVGAAEVEAGSTDVTFGSAVGVARLERGGRVRLGGGTGESSRFEVLVGTAQVQREGGAVTLTAGDRFVVDLGSATVERDTVERRVSSGAAPAGGDVSDARASGTNVSGDGGSAGGVDALDDEVWVEVSGRGAEALVDGHWRRLATGVSRVARGGELRIAQGTSLLLRGAEGEARVRGAATVRVGGAGEALATVTRGRIEVSARAGSVLRLDIPGGVLRVRAAADGHSRTDVEVNRDATSIRVVQGTATLDESDGPSGGSARVLSAGEQASIAARPTTAGPESSGDVTEQDAEPTPLVADLTLDARERATVHATRVPLAVRLRYDAICTGGGLIEVRRAGSGAAIRGGGRGTAVVSLAQGTHTLTLRCDGRVVAHGRLRILLDAGVHAAPRQAPQNTVDADGRRYTILYPSVLPVITVRWPRAPSASGYLLTVTPEHGRPAEFRTPLPEHTLASGQVPEGTHVVRWQTADGRARSAETTIRVEFDNTAPVAQVREPGPEAPVMGTTRVVVLAGEGAAVTVAEQPLTVEAGGRFTGQVRVPDGDRCLAVRVAVPRRGVHYFLRCGRP
jgi:hypothetical protein